MTTALKRVRDVGLSVLLLAFPALVFHASFKSETSQSVIDRVVLKIAAPLQAVVDWTVSGIGDTWKSYLFLVDVEGENKQLRKANRDLRAILAEKARIAVRVDALERLLALRKSTAAETIAARVVGAKMSPHFRVTRIQLEDSTASLRPHLPVIAAREGLENQPGAVVGLISRVYKSLTGTQYADVKLAVDPRSKIHVKVGVGDTHGYLRGVAGGSDYSCVLERVNRSDDVKVGDIVKTSGIKGYFPPDLVIGEVTHVSRKDYEVVQHVEVRPFVDFSNLDHVLVMLAPPPPPDPDLEDKKKTPSPPARGVGPVR